MAEDVELERAARFAPLVRVWRDDPPADPDLWLDDADLVRYDERGTALPLSAANDSSHWPVDARNEGVRPNERSAAGLAFVPRSRAPKFVPVNAEAPSFGRLPMSAGGVAAPCFYEAESDRNGLLLTYWFFFPTSTTPANQFAQLLPVVIDAMRDGELSPAEFPPVSVAVPRNAVHRFWEWVAASSSFGARLVRSARSMGTLGTFAAAVPVQALGVESMDLISQLDPHVQDLIASLYVHEGDWEGISVRLDPVGAFQEAVYWAHGKPVADPRPERQVIEGVDRIVVEVARGSHACGRPTADGASAPPANPVQRLRAEAFAGTTGANWRTWDHLRPARLQAWYGFGGGWGRPRLPPVGSLDRRSFGSMDIWVESTGPLGPGPLKLDRNRGAASMPRTGGVA
jgi:hypothetical protein